MLDDYCGIKTETDFVNYIHEKFGEGRFIAFAWQKGHEGFWVFWLGNLYPNGYFRDINKNTYIERMKRQFQKDLSQAETYEEKREIEESYEEDLEFEKDISKEINKAKRRGPYGLIPLRPNVLHGYDEQPEIRHD